MLKILRFLLCLCTIAQVGPARADTLGTLEQRWAELKYAHAADRDRIDQANALLAETAGLGERQPTPAVLLLHANVLCLLAEFMHSTASLAKIREARDLLLKAEAQAPDNADVLVTLGSIYYEVPGWPISFGNHKKAEQYLRHALAIDPDGRDSNYFMGDFLLANGRAGQAIPYLEKALAAPQQETVMDRGRRAEIDQSLLTARRRIKR
jgi:tetratricopeptide (TPR) repeat protein